SSTSPCRFSRSTSTRRARCASRCPNRRMPRRQEKSKRLAVVDASNVAHATEGGEARLANIELVREKLREDGFEPVIVADAALRHKIDRRADYERLVNAGLVHQAPAGTDADYFILSFAREMNARILTNDRFRDRANDFPQ